MDNLSSGDSNSTTLERYLSKLCEIRLVYGKPEVSDEETIIELVPYNISLICHKSVSAASLWSMKDHILHMLDMQTRENELSAFADFINNKLRYLLSTLSEEKIDDTQIPTLFNFLGKDVKYAIRRDKEVIFNQGFTDKMLSTATRRSKKQKSHVSGIDEGELFTCHTGEYYGYFLRKEAFEHIEISIIEIQLNMLSKTYKQHRLHVLINELNNLFISEFNTKNQLNLSDTLDEFKDNFGHLLDAALKDSLTQTYNRNKTSELLEEICKSNSYATVFLVDIDHFKKVNDTYGHLVGDKVLVGVVNRLRGEIRENDILARWGGEEFLIVIKNASEDALKALAQRMLERVQELPIVDDISVTVSIGVSSLRPHDNPESLLARADEALYQAKATGRNKVIFS